MAWTEEMVARLIVIGETRFEARLKAAYDLAIRTIIDKGLSRADVYAAGAWALRYMDYKYGVDKIIALLTSKERLFADAIKKELGVTVDEFESGLKQWLRTLSPHR